MSSLGKKGIKTFASVRHAEYSIFLADSGTRYPAYISKKGFRVSGLAVRHGTVETPHSDRRRRREDVNG